MSDQNRANLMAEIAEIREQMAKSKALEGRLAMAQEAKFPERTDQRMYEDQLILEESHKHEVRRRMKKKKKKGMSEPLPQELIKAWQEAETAKLEQEVWEMKVKRMEELVGIDVKTVVQGRITEITKSVELRVSTMVPMEAIRVGDTFWAISLLEQFVNSFRAHLAKEMAKVGGQNLVSTEKREAWERFVRENGGEPEPMRKPLP